MVIIVLLCLVIHFFCNSNHWLPYTSQMVGTKLCPFYVILHLRYKSEV